MASELSAGMRRERGKASASSSKAGCTRQDHEREPQHRYSDLAEQVSSASPMKKQRIRLRRSAHGSTPNCLKAIRRPGRRLPSRRGGWRPAGTTQSDRGTPRAEQANTAALRGAWRNPLAARGDQKFQRSRLKHGRRASHCGCGGSQPSLLTAITMFCVNGSPTS